MSSRGRIKVTLLAGGVGGAKMAEGLDALENVDLSIIGNVADDEEFHGLWVSPDIDTMTYTLSGQIDRQKGWGVADEGTRALDTLTRLGEDTWMMLGDRDLGLHIYRTKRRIAGDRPTLIARDVAKAFGIKASIILPTDDRVQTQVKTELGWLSFQQYFVREQCRPEISEIRFDGIGAARPTEEALSALVGADLIIIAPSNPLVSIAPILATSGLTDALKASSAPKIAVSPLIAGKVIKGPADRMMAALGMRADAVGVAERYAGLVDQIVIDHQDGALADQIHALGLACQTSDIVMRNASDKARLARQLLDFAQQEPDKEAVA